MDSFDSFIERYETMIGDHIASIKAFLSGSKAIGWEYSKVKKSKSGNPFNVFTMASDLYYRENFHSDIIRVFLDTAENHNEGNAFLFAFIDFINKSFGNKVSISKQDYETAKAEREPGRIDILVSSEASKHCIIIENKMNNAPDTHRQLPKYYDRMTGLGYKVDAIVYLPLNADKIPGQTTWTDEDRQHVLPLLCIVPAYRQKGMNLVEGWLEPCTLKTKNIDCVSVIRQYSELIKILSKNIMDNVILEKFYNSLLVGENHKTAISIKNMLTDLPIYMKDRIADILMSKNHNNVWKWKQNPKHCGLIHDTPDGQYKIDIWSHECGYTIKVFGQNMSIKDVPWSDNILAGLNQLNFVVKTDGYERYEKEYSFTDEAKVIEEAEIIEDLMCDMLKQNNDNNKDKRAGI